MMMMMLSITVLPLKEVMGYSLSGLGNHFQDLKEAVSAHLVRVPDAERRI